MRENLEAAGLTLREAPIKSPVSIGIVGRYHEPYVRSKRDSAMSRITLLEMRIV